MVSIFVFDGVALQISHIPVRQAYYKYFAFLFPKAVSSERLNNFYKSNQCHWSHIRRIFQEVDAGEYGVEPWRVRRPVSFLCMVNVSPVSHRFLPHFDCDLLLNRRTATWNLFFKFIFIILTLLSQHCKFTVMRTLRAIFFYSWPVGTVSLSINYLWC